MKLFILVALTLSALTSGHTHLNAKNEPANHLRCASNEKTKKLLNENEEYRIKYQTELKNSRQFVNLMKNSENHSFRKNVKQFHKNNEKQSVLDTLRGKNANSNDIRRLYSEYDDQIDNEPLILIPIVYHVMYSNDRGNLPDSQLDSQIDVLNKDFRAINDEILAGDVANIWSDRVGDTKIEFYKNATVRVSISSDSLCLDDNEAFKLSTSGGSDAWDPKHYLNVWICNISSEGLLGYAYQPCLIDTSEEWRDGLVLGSDNVGSYKDDDGSFWFPEGSVYNEGRTATHEIGHYLALDHIWGTDTTDSCSDSDDVSDTPNQYGANYGCPDNSTNSCTSQDPETGTDLRDMYENFMDYSNDECMYIFTEEQVWKMRAVLSGTGCRREFYYQGAQLGVNETFMPSGERSAGSSFTCNDGCSIPEDYIDDGYCDCTDCEDEANLNCNKCYCPSTCPGTTYYCGAACFYSFTSKVLGVALVSFLLTHVL